MRTIAALPEHERDAARLAGTDLLDDVQRRARIQARAEPSRESVAEERRRRARRAVTSDEFGAVGSVRSRCLRRAPERHGTTELRVVAVAREDRAGRVIHFGDDE